MPCTAYQCNWVFMERQLIACSGRRKMTLNYLRRRNEGFFSWFAVRLMNRWMVGGRCKRKRDDMWEDRRHTEKQVGGWMGGKVDGWMDGWMDERMDGWMGG